MASSSSSSSSSSVSVSACAGRRDRLLCWNDSVIVRGEKPNRGVYAKCPLKAGTIILKESPITTPILHPKQWSIRCNFCFSKPTTSNNKLLRCSRCRLFWYCCKQCQRRDWKFGGHREECTVLSQHYHYHENDHHEDQQEQQNIADALLVGRVFRLKKSNPELFQIIEDLVYHKSCINQSHKDIAKLFLTMKLLDDDDKNNTAMNTTTKDILQMLARFDSNNFGIVDELLFLLGTGIYPGGAMLNHSCHPNCSILYQNLSHSQPKQQTQQQQVQVIRCIVDVGTNEELCHPYVDFAMTSTSRKEKLYKTYGFHCQCERCLDKTGKWSKIDQWLVGTIDIDDNDIDIDYIDTARSIEEETEPLLQQAARSQDINEELDLIRQCVMKRQATLHKYNLSLYASRSQYHTTAMAAGQFDIAREQCTHIIETMRQCFYSSRQHPLIGIMIYTLGSLHHSLNSFEQAIHCYEEAIPILTNYHGRDHPFTIGCCDYLQQAKQQQQQQQQAEE